MVIDKKLLECLANIDYESTGARVIDLNSDTDRNAFNLPKRVDESLRREEYDCLVKKEDHIDYSGCEIVNYRNKVGDARALLFPDKVDRSFKQRVQKNTDRKSKGQKKEVHHSGAEPPGFNQEDNKQFEALNGHYFYERCHLIPYRFVNKKAIYGQLFTGTRFLNDNRNFKEDKHPCMQIYEDCVADWLLESDVKFIYYQAIPVYQDFDIVPRGVRLIAKCYNDNNEEIVQNNRQFDIYLLNVTPGYCIDYATGKWKEHT